MSKSGFSVTPPTAPVDPIERMAREAAGTPLETRRPLPVKEATKTMSLNVPKSFYDDLRNFMKLTDITMTDVLVAGGRKELERLKKHYGID
jgi:hypothetical protein